MDEIQLEKRGIHSSKGLIGHIGPIGLIGLIQDWVGGERSLTGVRDDMGAEFGMTWERSWG